jgi:hypothetical protein
LSHALFKSTVTHGVVYAEPWPVEPILDLAGYTVDGDPVAVEPAAGVGGFLGHAAKRPGNARGFVESR